MGNVSMKWLRRDERINSSGRSGKGSFPRLFLIIISHAEAALKNTSLSGSENCLRAITDKSGLSEIIHKNEHVSNRIFKTLLPGKGPLSLRAVPQKKNPER